MKHPRLPALAAALLLTVLLAANPTRAGSSGSGTKGPSPGLKPLAADGALQLSAGDRCPVCAMRVARHPRFAAAIELADGRTFYFCATGCMIRSWMHPEIYLGVDTRQLNRPMVQDYFSGRAADGRRVIWVAGSDVVGPMGPALVPIANKEDLPAFVRRHGSKSTFHLQEMTDRLWETITGKKAVR